MVTPDPAKTHVLAQCRGVGHFGFSYPSDASNETLRAFVVFWESLGCAVEVVPSASDVAEPNVWYRFFEKYGALGFWVLTTPEDASADRAGSVRRLRVRRRRYGDLFLSYAAVSLSMGQFAEIIDLLRGLHVLLRFEPTDLERLLAHPNFERGPTRWGQTRTNVSVYLKDPFGLEIECQTTCQVDDRL